MNFGFADGMRNGRVIATIALAYLLVLKALFAPFPASSTSLPDFVICVAHDAGGEPAPGGGHPADSCCDEGCLLRLASFVAPLLLAIAAAFAVVRTSVSLNLRPLALAAGPPGRKAARPQAPRAPPVAFA